MTQTEALQKALDALNEVTGWQWAGPMRVMDEVEDAITAIKEALAQPEQDWRNAAIRVGEDLSSVGPDGYYDMTAQQWLDWAMEQQPRGKNSLAQPEQGFVCSTGLCHFKAEQEPVAWAWKNTKTDGRGIYWENPNQFFDLTKPSDYEWIPLYTTPPQRTWQGLTDEERNTIYANAGTGREAMKVVEAKLKEKNNG